MMSGELDALAASDSAYLIRDNPEGGWDLVERATRRVVWNDAMEPEDAMLVRDLYPLVELLNRTAKERDDAMIALDGVRKKPHVDIARLQHELKVVIQERDAASQERDALLDGLLSQKLLRNIAISIVQRDPGDPLSSVKVYGEGGKALGYLPAVAIAALSSDRDKASTKHASATDVRDEIQVDSKAFDCDCCRDRTRTMYPAEYDAKSLSFGSIDYVFVCRTAHLALFAWTQCPECGGTGKKSDTLTALKTRAEAAERARDEALATLEEREGEMHLRIRAGYDRTVADCWRAEVAKVERARDEAHAQVAGLKSALEPFVMAADSTDECGNVDESAAVFGQVHISYAHLNRARQASVGIDPALWIERETLIRERDEATSRLERLCGSIDEDVLLQLDDAMSEFPCDGVDHEKLVFESLASARDRLRELVQGGG